MNFTFNGETPDNINYNGYEVDILKYNGETVWEKGSPEPEPTDLEKSVILTLVDGSTDVVTFEDGKIPTSAFTNRTDIDEVIIGSDFTTIPQYAFKGCTSLTSVVCKGQIYTIQQYCFYGCSNISVIDFSNNFEIVRNLRLGVETNVGITSIPTSIHYIVVPDELYDEWMSSDRWRSYTTKIISKSDYEFL